MDQHQRRLFLKQLAVGGMGTMIDPFSVLKDENEKGLFQAPGQQQEDTASAGTHAYNGEYTGEHLNRVAFPIGGLGAGMFCLEGTGAISHMSVRNRPEIYHEPATFAVISVKGFPKGAKVVEGPVP